MTNRYAIKIAVVEVSDKGEDIDDTYEVMLNDASTDYTALKNFVDLLIERAEAGWERNPETDSDRVNYPEKEEI